ncbi:hypothetical protein ACLKA6_010890 [Drosophila palustris]
MRPHAPREPPLATAIRHQANFDGLAKARCLHFAGYRVCGECGCVGHIFPPPRSVLGPWAHGPMASVWFVALYTQLQGASNQSQTRGHGLGCSSPALMLCITGWGEIITTMGHGGVPLD